MGRQFLNRWEPVWNSESPGFPGFLSESLDLQESDCVEGDRVGGGKSIILIGLYDLCCKPKSFIVSDVKFNL